jgi:hypothetical protein
VDSYGSSFLFPRNVDSIGGCGSGRGEEPAGKCPPPDSDPLTALSLEELTPARQNNSPQAHIADSTSKTQSPFDLFSQ